MDERILRDEEDRAALEGRLSETQAALQALRDTRPPPPPAVLEDRLERAAERLKDQRDQSDGLRARVRKLEGDLRASEERRAQQRIRDQRVLRELQHLLESERRAYKIQRLQAELLVDRARGAEQQLAEKAESAAAEAAERAYQEVLQAADEGGIEAATIKKEEIAPEERKSFVKIISPEELNARRLQAMIERQRPESATPPPPPQKGSSEVPASVDQDTAAAAAEETEAAAEAEAVPEAEAAPEA
ncbi:MAG: hypothetical protein VYD19_07465, partial [Myxococcota bacterium]|nr:hypothetical protein [Myxococcota bacterium]